MRDFDDGLGAGLSVGGADAGGSAATRAGECAGGVSGVLDHLESIGASVSHIDGYSASDLLKELDKVVAVAESVRLRAVTRIEESGVWSDAVNGTPNSFLRSRHRKDHGEAGICGRRSWQQSSRSWVRQWLLAGSPALTWM